MTTDLVSWLTAVWDERETAYKVADKNPYSRHLLARIAADRKILAEHRGEEVASLDRGTRGQMFIVCARCRMNERQIVYPCMTVRLLASACADRPGWQEEWAV